MQSVIGIFNSVTAAEQTVASLIGRGIKRDCIIFASLHSSDGNVVGETAEQELKRLPTTDAEADGMGAGIGALLGGGVGASAGLAGGAAIASMLIPGVGTIFAIGLGAAALLGLGGAAAGAKAGEMAEHALDIGVPRDDVSFYRDLLQSGRSLVIANVEGDELASTVRNVFREQGSEDAEAARRDVRLAQNAPAKAVA